MSTNPIDNQTNPSDVYIASRFKADTGYGDQADVTPSSLLPGDKIKYSPAAAKLRPVAPVDVKAAIVANETRTVSAAPITPAFGMKNPNANPPRVPSGTNRRASSIIAPRGSAKR
jgi:hypothetical protein